MSSASKERSGQQLPEDVDGELPGVSARVESGSVSTTSDPQLRAALLYELDAPELRSGAAATSGIAPVREPRAAANDQTQLRSESEPQLANVSESVALAAKLDALSETAAKPDSDTAALNSDVLLIAQPNAERSRSTRPSTHVAASEWFDLTLGDLNAGVAADARRRLAWRFKACVAAYRVLNALATTEARTELVALLRNYERSLRATGGTAPSDVKQITDALHAQLSPKALDEQERLLSKVEDKLLAIDETVSDEAFSRRFNKRHEKPKALMRYARLLAARRFNIGYRRDRFETLAQELLTAQANNGDLLLMPRVKAALVLRQLLRGLPQPQSSPEDQSAAITYLRDALDRLRNLSGAKQFFESGFFLDVHGYKVSMHDRITSPEFLYLCVALNVEIHNRLRAFAQPTSDGKKSPNSWDTLHNELNSQRTAVRGVFTNFRTAGPVSQRTQPVTKKAARNAKAKAPKLSAGATSLTRLLVVTVVLLGALAVNLVELGFVELTQPPRQLGEAELQALTPLLLRGSIDSDSGHFRGLLSRPQWRRLDPRARKQLASEIANKLHKQNIDHAELLIYKSRAIEIRYGSVAYVDDAK